MAIEEPWAAFKNPIKIAMLEKLKEEAIIINSFNDQILHWFPDDFHGIYHQL